MWKINIFNNFWPKVISLFLAIATWFYVFDLVNTESYIQKKEAISDIFSRYKFAVKEVDVKPVFTGESPKGYRVVFDKVKVEPPKVTIFGPKDVIGDIDEMDTEKIDLGEYTRSTQLSLSVHSDTKFLKIENKVVNVFLPIEPLEKKENGLHK